jgi:hypothetical protein
MRQHATKLIFAIIGYLFAIISQHAHIADDLFCSAGALVPLSPKETSLAPSGCDETTRDSDCKIRGPATVTLVCLNGSARCTFYYGESNSEGKFAGDRSRRTDEKFRYPERIGSC